MLYRFRTTMAVILAGAMLSACSTGTSTETTLPQPEENATSVADATTPNEVDIHFVGMMVPHHDQAIYMSDVLLASDVEDAQVRDLAQRIKDGQERENQQMLAWADEWQIQEDMDFHSQHIANGMFYPEQLEEFSKLEGEELRTTFLEWMHHHHADVIAMTQDEVDNGNHQELRELGEEMIRVQTEEMREMEQILGYTP